MKKWLVALPVYNEAQYIDAVLKEVCKYADDVLVVNDGSTDETADRLRLWQSINVVEHPSNRGYGAALKSAFQYAIDHDYDFLVTLDCDGQHQPRMIPEFVAKCEEADIVSGSRYLKKFPGDSTPPPERMKINRQITQMLNEQLGLQLTDAFCGFKGYRRETLEKFDIEEEGYAMPLEVWVQAAAMGMKIVEVPVPLLYLDLARSFGGALDDADRRLRHYNEVFRRSLEKMRSRGFTVPVAGSA